jgi:tricorn protease
MPVFIWWVLSSALSLSFSPPEEAPRWLQQPAAGPGGVVFVYGGDLWRVPLEGGPASRLTAGPGLEVGPALSPDGALLTFTGEYDGNVDVYLMPSAGGQPRRLTFHPEVDVALGFSPDGRRVLMRSNRDSHARFDRLFSLPIEGGGQPEALPLPMGVQAAIAPDGRLAYVPGWHHRTELDRLVAWKGYRGGRAAAIWLAGADGRRLEALPRPAAGSVDTHPMWLGGRLYFLSDRDGRTGLYAHDPTTGTVRREVDPGDADILSASAGAGLIAYDRLGEIHLYDPARRESRRLEVRLAADLPALRPHLAPLGGHVQTVRLSPGGKRVVLEARGEILTAPVEKGDVRNLSLSPGTAERDPAWSPDGRWVAGFSDASGEYALTLWPQDGRGAPRTIPLGEPPSFFYQPVWSPDGRRIAIHDKRLQLWVVEVASGRMTRVDQDLFERWERTLDPAWSPDSRFLVYTRQADNHLRAVHAWSVDERVARPLTDARSDVRHAAFDRSGQHLWFTASTDAGPSLAWLDLSSGPRSATRSVYLAVLDASLPSPLAPQSDEDPEPEKAKGKKTPAGDEKPTSQDRDATPTRIDHAGLDQRILALPIPARAWVGLYPGLAGEIYLEEDEPALGSAERTRAVWRFELEKRKPERLLRGIRAFELSADGKRMLFLRGKAWFAAEAGKAPPASLKPIPLGGLRAWVDPRAEQRQIFREVWRLQRDFFYDPGLHGVDWQAIAARYAPFVHGLGGRHDLNLLIQDMLGELRVGHLYIEAGARPKVRKVPGGLLGADFRLEAGRWRVARVLEGENWNPELRAPLTQPGAQVREGEYLLKVDGRELGAGDNLYAFLEGTAGRTVRLEVGPEPRGRGSREVRVVPLDSERQLRHRAWVQQNRRRVAELSGGRLGYVYLPNTSRDGLAAFDREYFAEVGKAGLVVDERFNGGGLVADYVVYGLRREALMWCATRQGRDFPSPMMTVQGPMAMLVNEYAGSGGDALPWMFRRLGLGPLIGTRTWGGLVGIYDYPTLVDGGWVTAPRIGFYSADGRWEAENIGVTPDIEVPFDVAAWRAGRDSQLERAVAEVLAALEKRPSAAPKRPPFPRPSR